MAQTQTKKKTAETGYVFVPDSDVRITNGIEMYLHCARCLRELPAGVSPMEYARTQTGFTKDGALQVWCNRHNVNVGLITVERIQ